MTLFETMFWMLVMLKRIYTISGYDNFSRHKFSFTPELLNKTFFLSALCPKKTQHDSAHAPFDMCRWFSNCIRIHFALTKTVQFLAAHS